MIFVLKPYNQIVPKQKDLGELELWVKQNCQNYKFMLLKKPGTYMTNAIEFLDDSSAALFKLFWDGAIDYQE